MLKPTISLPSAFLISLTAFAQNTNESTSTNAVRAEMEQAIHQVEKIVNQPVTAYRRTPGMDVGRFQGGWFHPGAITPNFDTVDVRQTQDTSEYRKSEWVTSDLNPGIVWRGTDVEFNSMTKYFYTNRNVPKKKLTDAEMQEINRLYRIIGHCQHELNRITPVEQAALKEVQSNDTVETETPPGKRPRLLNPYIGGAAIGGLIILLVLVNLIRKR
jgi:hypothetical protein